MEEWLLHRHPTCLPCCHPEPMSEVGRDEWHPPVFSFPINQSIGPACMAARPGPLQRGVLSCVPTAFPPRLVESVTEGSGSPGHPDEPCPIVIPQAACWASKQWLGVLYCAIEATVINYSGFLRWGWEAGNLGKLPTVWSCPWLTHQVPGGRSLGQRGPHGMNRSWTRRQNSGVLVLGS